MPNFVNQICLWQKTQGRHNLPWQKTQEPYRVWLSEIMLQQTQVATVIDYYLRFIQRFPDIQTLANATLDEVLGYWAGLGYYARARNLHRCADLIMTQYGGRFPRLASEIIALPGIGKSTAHAIMAFCFNTRTPIMDGNVKRIFTRYFGIKGNPNSSAVDHQLWQQAESILAQSKNADMPTYTQGLMDLGATVCKRLQPNCMACPLTDSCYAKLHHLQRELPTPKPSKIIPTRHTCMLIIKHKEEVLLERRPTQGIWGGMYSLPEFDQEKELLQYLQNLGLKQNQLQKLSTFEHVFSHFKLHIKPFLLSHDSSLPLQDKVVTSNKIWQNLQHLKDAPLPKPIFQVLSGLSSLLGL